MGTTCSKRDDSISTHTSRKGQHQPVNVYRDELSTPVGQPQRSARHGNRHRNGFADLGTPPSPYKASSHANRKRNVKVDAKWGDFSNEEQENVCSDFEPNPFKFGFCKNCMKQHDVTGDGQVITTNVSTTIIRPNPNRYASNAEFNPAATGNMKRKNSMNSSFNSTRNSASWNSRSSGSQRESDVDLAALLQERQKVMHQLGIQDQYEVNEVILTTDHRVNPRNFKRRSKSAGTGSHRLKHAPKYASPSPSPISPYSSNSSSSSTSSSSGGRYNSKHWTKYNSFSTNRDVRGKYDIDYGDTKDEWF